MFRQRELAKSGAWPASGASVRFFHPRHLTRAPPPANYVNVINIHMEKTCDDWGCGDARRLRQTCLDCRDDRRLHPVLARGPGHSRLLAMERTHGMWWT